MLGWGLRGRVDVFSLKNVTSKMFSSGRLTSLHLFGHRVSVHPLQEEEEEGSGRCSGSKLEERHSGRFPGYSTSLLVLPAATFMGGLKVTQEYDSNLNGSKVEKKGWWQPLPATAIRWAKLTRNSTQEEEEEECLKIFDEGRNWKGSFAWFHCSSCAFFSSNQDDSIFLNILAHYAKRPSVCVFVKTCQNIASIIQWVIAQNATASSVVLRYFRAGALQRGFRDLFHPRSNILWRLNSPNIGEIELLLFHILHTKTELLQTNCNEHTAISDIRKLCF